MDVLELVGVPADLGDDKSMADAATELGRWTVGELQAHRGALLIACELGELVNGWREWLALLKSDAYVPRVRAVQDALLAGIKLGVRALSDERARVDRAASVRERVTIPRGMW